MGEEWDDSTQSKEQIEASIVSKQEATVRRERALAYAFSHQVLLIIIRNICGSSRLTYCCLKVRIFLAEFLFCLFSAYF
jgi:hypothetical protein